MTTTLRPAEPERRGPDGARSRRYTVCVNSRPVGAIQLSTDQRFGPESGRIAGLSIDEPDRGRGRATIAALAAEEVLRDWGCRRIETAIPASASAAIALAAVLGYTEQNRGMFKTLPLAPPPLPEGSALHSLAAAEFPAWHEHEQSGYVENWTVRGIPYERALAIAEAGHRLLLPDGPATADTVLGVLSHRGTDVGTLWVRLRDPDRAQAPAWVCNVEVAEQHRGHGHGRTLMLAAERECLAAGVRTLGLNVFADNTPALRLYESLGYQATDLHFSKPLG
ncbi:GNAT family N-acetyltransferase [Actinacidiphila oryziradicis]|uniref:GNAT family N-acetyltransferase n=1 Tax=Actinacidiphila oryziradicis TaxID=2571141 RepID=A0A4U0T911_9ACTN|nr:GNAT family N-acetyltransferase [Actinacidiphila oryziradicis]TKA12435.1 GNAT family N-acetyltransferase [Actinacidiphila oryziradicis]